MLKVFLFVLAITLCHNANAFDRKIDITQAKVNLQKKRLTFKDLRDIYVIKQSEDTSCGSAALATLINLLYNEKCTEKEIINSITAGKTQDELYLIYKAGFSLLQLAQAADKKGYHPTYRKNCGIKHLDAFKGPVIVRLSTDDYSHFVVFKYKAGGRIYLADPTRGNTMMMLSKFMRQWDGTCLAI